MGGFLLERNYSVILFSMFLGIFLLLNSAGAEAGIPPANTQGTDRMWLDVPYASESASQKMDIYLPKEGQGPFPVILAIHGGGFCSGDKGTMEVDGELTGLNRGYAVVSINYRLSSEAVFPAALFDVKAALRFLRAHAAEYQIDSRHIAVWGDSAGANLAALAGTTAGHPELEDLTQGNAAESSAVNAVVAWFPPVNYLTEDAQFRAKGITPYFWTDLPDSDIAKYVGAPIQEISGLMRFTNPENFITKDTVPFFIENGAKDTVVPPEQGRDFAARLKSAIGAEKVTYIQLPEAEHRVAHFMGTDNLDKVFAFLDKYLKNP